MGFLSEFQTFRRSFVSVESEGKPTDETVTRTTDGEGDNFTPFQSRYSRCRFPFPRFGEEVLKVHGFPSLLQGVLYRCPESLIYSNPWCQGVRDTFVSRLSWGCSLLTPHNEGGLPVNGFPTSIDPLVEPSLEEASTRTTSVACWTQVSISGQVD